MTKRMTQSVSLYQSMCVARDRMAAYREECHEQGEVPCVTPAHHSWVVSDENEEVAYCQWCGCCEY